MSWASGYETDVDYTFGYYRELAPPLMRFALLLAGRRPPPFERYLELGAGRGLSANIHAASNPMSVACTDFMPSHAADARAFAHASGLTVYEDSFEEFFERIQSGEVEHFDTIAFHGVYSWVSDERRREIRQICRLGLDTGGVVYNSYNAMPGWAPAVPLQRLFRMYANQLSIATDPIEQRTKEAVVLARQLADGGALYNTSNPGIKARLDSITDFNFNYAVHEYQNEVWDCFYFADVVEQMNECKLSYAGSAFILDHVPGVRVQPHANEMLEEISSPIMREQIRDYWVNTGFRRDLFVRGATPLTMSARKRAISDTRVIPCVPKSAVKLEAKGPYGPIKLSAEVYPQALDVLYTDGKPTRIKDFAATARFEWPTALEVISVLMGMGVIAPCHEDGAISKLRTRCKTLNKLIRERAREDHAINTLASPVTGVGVTVGRLDQLFLSAIEAGEKSLPAWVEHAHEGLRGAGQIIQHEGMPLAEKEAAVAHMMTIGTDFERDRLPVFRHLGLV